MSVNKRRKQLATFIVYLVAEAEVLVWEGWILEVCKLADPEVTAADVGNVLEYLYRSYQLKRCEYLGEYWYRY